MSDKKIRAMIVPADTGIDCSIGEVNDDWRAMGTVVGGYIEVVHTQTLMRVHPQLAMVVNEEGHLKGLPYNDRASSLYSNLLGIPIVGDVILVGEAKSREYFIDLPSEIQSWQDVLDRLGS